MGREEKQAENRQSIRLRSRMQQLRRQMRERGDNVSTVDNIETIFEAIGMRHIRNIAIVAVLVVAVGTVVAIKQNKKPVETAMPSAGVTGASETVSLPIAQAQSQSSQPGAAQALPKLIDLGAGKCIPCKMMAPILEDLKKTHADKFEVQFIDVWQNPEPGRKYGIRVIPTQIFFAPDGKELFRHEGFYGKEDILGKWKELGFAFNGNNQ